MLAAEDREVFDIHMTTSFQTALAHRLAQLACDRTMRFLPGSSRSITCWFDITNAETDSSQSLVTELLVRIVERPHS